MQPSPVKTLLRSVVNDPSARPAIRDEAARLLRIWPPATMGYEDTVHFLVGMIAGLRDRIEELEKKEH